MRALRFLFIPQDGFIVKDNVVVGAKTFWETRIELGENFCPLLVKATAITLKHNATK